MSDHDNANKGALWDVTAFSGKANAGGIDWFADLVPTNARNESAPCATLYLRARDRFHAVAVFRPTREAKYDMSGKCDAVGVRVFVYRVTEGKERSPAYRLSFLSLDDQRPPDEQRKAAAPVSHSSTDAF